MPSKAYPVTEGFYWVQNHSIPKSCVRHFIDGYQGKEFAGRVVMSTDNSSSEYQVETQPLFYFRQGERARQRVEADERRLYAAEHIEANPTVYTIVDTKAPKKERKPLTEEQREQQAAARDAANIYRELPKIVVVLGVTDHGPCDMGATAICPHCGAEGRYIYSFKCADGTTRGAMRGCLSKFPRHRFASESQRILEKALEYQKNKWQLPSWDKEIKDAIFAFADNQISEPEANERIRKAQAARDRYRQARRRR